MRHGPFPLHRCLSCARPASGPAEPCVCDEYVHPDTARQTRYAVGLIGVRRARRSLRVARALRELDEVA